MDTLPTNNAPESPAPRAAEQSPGGLARRYAISAALAAVAVATLAKGLGLVVFWAATQVVLWAVRNSRTK